MPLVINNKILLSDDGRRRERLPESIKVQVIHRIDFSKDDGGGRFDNIAPIPTDQLTGDAVSQRFHDGRTVLEVGHHWADRPGAYTGLETPYTFLVRTDGQIDQCLEVGDIGPHAVVWNVSGLSIAVAGDFRKHSPRANQMTALIQFCSLWAAWGLEIFGHTELAKSSRHPNKQCPGLLFPLVRLRTMAKGHSNILFSTAEAEMALGSLGVVF